MKRPGWLLLAAWLVVFAACRGVESVGAPCSGGGASAGPPPAPQPAPQLGHVFIVVEENTDCGHVIGNPGIGKLDFELLSLAVSAINACGDCEPASR